MNPLTPSELRRARKCVKDSLNLRKSFVKTAKRVNLSGEPEVRRRVSRFETVEIPALTELLNKLKGK